MANTNTPIRVVCALIKREDTWLLCQRSATQSNPGCWEFPGGKIEIGESSGDAIVRELHEELGVEVSPIMTLHPVLHEYPDKYISLIPVACKLPADASIQLSEHQAYGWFNREEIAQLGLSAADVLLAAQYCR